jgi:nuclease-like protein
MRIIELSDHPGDQLQAVVRQREHAEEQALAAYEQELARHRSSVAAARTARDEARAQRRWLAWLLGVFAVWAERARTPSRPVFYHEATDQEAILTAGVHGEQLAANELGRLLSNDWVLLRGYKNSRGEIDHLLLGPSGIFALEVKHRNATVYIDGDEWRFEKYDRFGNLVEQGRITDRGGRSPSRQVNDSADALQRFLNTRYHQRVIIQRIVLLTHPRSELGSHRNLTVSVATSVDTVLGWMREPAPTLQPAQITELHQLIERDHRHHQAHDRSRHSTGPQERRPDPRRST